MTITPSAGSRLLLPALLSMTAGAVDIIGFLALGVFTAHITGNLVILAAHYITSLHSGDDYEYRPVGCLFGAASSR